MSMHVVPDEEERPKKPIFEMFKLIIGSTEVKIYCNTILPEASAFLSPTVYEAVKAHFQKEADKTQSIKNAISSNESDQPIS